MKKHILVLLAVSTTLVAQKMQAATFTVKKTKGNSAVIESSAPLVEGETYTIQSSKQTDLISEDVVYTRPNRSRGNSFSLGIDSSFFKSSDLQEHHITIESRYGWNSTDYEVGPTLKVSMIDEGAGFDSEYLVGGYFDYNFNSNVVNEDAVYGLTAQALAGNREFNTGSNAQVFALGGGGFLTWYLMRSNAALRTEGVIEQKRIATDRTSSNVFGFVGKMFLTFYF